MRSAHRWLVSQSVNTIPRGEYRVRPKEGQESLTFEFEETNSMEKPKEPGEK